MELFWKLDCISEGLIASSHVPTTGGCIAKGSPAPERSSIFRQHRNLRGNDPLQRSDNEEFDNPTGEWVAKCISSKTLLDVSGKVLSLHAAGLATTWRTHHAFSARCGLAANLKTIHSSESAARTDYGVSEEAEKVHDDIETCCHELPFRGTLPWMLRSARFYREWKIDLYLRSTCTDPHILVSVAPHYFAYGNGNNELSNGEEEGAYLPTERDEDDKNALLWPRSMEDKIAYDKRILETPLVYEEPYVVSAEFGLEGIRLWSDHWERYGEQVSEHHLEPFFSKEDSFPQAFSPLSFNRRSPDPERGVAEDGIARNQRPTEGTPLGYQGLIRLQWSTLGPCSEARLRDTSTATLSVFIGKTIQWDAQNIGLDTPSEAANLSENSLRINSKDIEWQHAFDTTLQLDPGASNLLFVPYVTLLECGDEVLLIN